MFIRRVFRSIKRRRVLFLVNKVYAGAKHFKRKRKLLISIGYEIGEGTKIVGPIECHAKIKIGKNCWIGKNLIVNGNGELEIGDNCDIAPEVTFLTGGHKIGDAERRAGEGVSYKIKIGNGVWIGGRSTVLNNTEVGNSCMIAACSCVNKNVEDNSLVGGVPARLIRKLN